MARDNAPAFGYILITPPPQREFRWIIYIHMVAGRHWSVHSVILSVRARVLCRRGVADLGPTGSLHPSRGKRPAFLLYALPTTTRTPVRLPNPLFFAYSYIIYIFSLSVCVCVYLNPQNVRELLSHFNARLTSSIFLRLKEIIVICHSLSLSGISRIGSYFSR